MSAEDFAAQEPAAMANEVIADGIEAGIVAGETGDDEVIDNSTLPIADAIAPETEETSDTETTTETVEESAETPAEPAEGEAETPADGEADGETADE